jgi:hypothetical protein
VDKAWQRVKHELTDEEKKNYDEVLSSTRGKIHSKLEQFRLKVIGQRFTDAEKNTKLLDEFKQSGHYHRLALPL